MQPSGNQQTPKTGTSSHHGHPSKSKSKSKRNLEKEKGNAEAFIIGSGLRSPKDDTPKRSNTSLRHKRNTFEDPQQRQPVPAPSRATVDGSNEAMPKPSPRNFPGGVPTPLALGRGIVGGSHRVAPSTSKPPDDDSASPFPLSPRSNTLANLEDQRVVRSSVQQPPQSPREMSPRPRLVPTLKLSPRSEGSQHGDAEFNLARSTPPTTQHLEEKPASPRIHPSSPRPQRVEKLQHLLVKEHARDVSNATDQELLSIYTTEWAKASRLETRRLGLKEKYEPREQKSKTLHAEVHEAEAKLKSAKAMFDQALEASQRADALRDHGRRKITDIRQQEEESQAMFRVAEKEMNHRGMEYAKHCLKGDPQATESGQKGLDSDDDLDRLAATIDSLKLGGEASAKDTQ